MTRGRRYLVTFVLWAALLGCRQETIVRQEAAEPRIAKPSPTAHTTPTPTELPSPTPARTKSPEELKYEKERGPTPTPPPLEINGYGTQPRIFYRQGGPRQGQLVVFLSTIVYEEVGPRNVVLELEGKPASGVTLKGVELFEAQDLLVNFEVTPEASVGHYDARIGIGGKEFFLADIFEVRSSP